MIPYREEREGGGRGCIRNLGKKKPYQLSIDEGNQKNRGVSRKFDKNIIDKQVGGDPCPSEERGLGKVIPFVMDAGETGTKTVRRGGAIPDPKRN